MQHTQVVLPRQNIVRAVFATSVAVFDIPHVATLQHLADRLSLIGERHVGPLTSIDIRPAPHAANAWSGVSGEVRH